MAYDACMNLPFQHTYAFLNSPLKLHQDAADAAPCDEYITLFDLKTKSNNNNNNNTIYSALHQDLKALKHVNTKTESTFVHYNRQKQKTT